MNISERIIDYIEYARDQIDKIEDVLERTTSKKTEKYVKQLLFYTGVINLGVHLLDDLKSPSKMRSKVRI